MWRDVEYHRRLTDLIRSSRIDDDLAAAMVKGNDND
jgi:hypothetical protein